MGETGTGRVEDGAWPLGAIPPLGQVPARMHAMAIRRERHGEPRQAFQHEIVDVPPVGPDEVLVYVMAAGVNYNGVWAALGQPLSPLDVHGEAFHIAGSDASGVVWAVGDAVRNCKVGDEVVVHCNQTCGQCHNCNGGEPMLCREQQIWGYETSWGSFAQFCKVQAQQVLTKPKHLTWEEAGCYMLVYATAWRMLYGHTPHSLKPAMNVLVWGGSGGLGTMATQICKAAGANAIAVVSSEDKGAWCLANGAKAWLNRKEFDCWGPMPDTADTATYSAYSKRVRAFGKAIWAVTGGVDVDIVFEHPGEQTFPVSCFVVRRGGMVVFCAGTTGYNLTFDARYVWMRQKRIQGSHFASRYEADQANHLVMDGRIDAALSTVFAFDEVAEPHTLMWENRHPPGNMGVLVNATARGCRNLEESRAAQGGAA
ncbi:MAG: crotonyl-CoA carboxylase/reductase [Deltaproteobacteria bacterium]|nr:crotonyl-CoA carboxylase/reductase [Deltaproteobacteria bacterium]MCB9785953.1 crotonyl-CoA carboxylase/reductase [Deltaproteobacteria bacterium]